MEKLLAITSTVEQFVVLSQEPNTIGHSVVGLNKGHSIINGLVERPRAYVYCHKDLKAWQVDALCSRDTAACIIDTTDAKNKKILFVVFTGREG